MDTHSQPTVRHITAFMVNAPKPLFHPGQVVATPGAIAALDERNLAALPFLIRHLAGDWSEMDEEDQQANDYALRHGLRVLSSYRLDDHQRLWLITEADRSSTTLLLPEEY